MTKRPDKPGSPPPAASAAASRWKAAQTLAARWAGPAVIAATAAAMLAWSWRKWPDILVDFGRELYIPWQLAQGKVLYTEVAQFMGPLSSYWNALWFRLFGSSLLTVVFVNVALTAILIFLLYRLLSEVGSRLSATAACLAFVTLFAFSQFVGYGNYNFVCPYTHEVTHGMILSVAGLFFLSRFVRGGGLVDVVAVGLAFGLLALTKAEMFLAGGAAMLAGLALAFWVRRTPGRRLATHAGAFLAAAVLPALVAFILMARVMPAAAALRSLLSSWPVVVRGSLTGTTFYLQGMGLLNPWENFGALLAWTGWYAAVFVPAALAGLAMRKGGWWRFAVAAAVFAALAGLLGIYWKDINWMDAARPLPLFLLLMGVAGFVIFLRHRHDAGAAGPWVMRLALVIFALALLPKMILNTRIYHYGFVMAMPATLLLVVALVDWVPGLVTRWGGYGQVFRAAALAALAVAVFAHLQIVHVWFARKTVPVGTGADVILADARGLFVNEALKEIARRAGPRTTLAVLPEGETLNFLSRLANPTPYHEIMPGAFVVFDDEDVFVDTFDRHPPDLIALVHKDTREFGEGFFGSGYGRRLFAWIARNYRPVWLVGALPNQDERFGILLLERKK